MSRPQVSFAVDDLAAAVRFYTGIFASPPTVVTPGCAQWIVDGSAVHFTIFARHAASGRDRPLRPQGATTSLIRRG